MCSRIVTHNKLHIFKYKCIYPVCPRAWLQVRAGRGPGACHRARARPAPAQRAPRHGHCCGTYSAPPGTASLCLPTKGSNKTNTLIGSLRKNFVKIMDPLTWSGDHVWPVVWTLQLIRWQRLYAAHKSRCALKLVELFSNVSCEFPIYLNGWVSVTIVTHISR